MSFVVRKLRLAEEDALEAAIWYEERQTGLGDEFLDEIDRGVGALSESALRNRIRFADVRRAPVARDLSRAQASACIAGARRAGELSGGKSSLTRGT